MLWRFPPSGGTEGGLRHKKREPRSGLLLLAALLGGGYLLSHSRSTIGVVRLNFSVRNGKRWNPHAITTLVSYSARRPCPGRVRDG